MLCKCHWIVLYIVHFTAFCLGGPFLSGHGVYTDTIRYDTIEEFNVDSKAEYTALSSTRSQKLKQTNKQCPFNCCM